MPSRPHDPNRGSSPLEVLALASLVGALACLVYLLFHIGLLNIYKYIKHMIKGGDDDNEESAFQARRKSRPGETPEEREQRRSEWRAEHGEYFPTNNFEEILQKASEELGHTKIKAKKWIKEQKKKGEEEFFREQRAVKKKVKEEEAARKKSKKDSPSKKKSKSKSKTNGDEEEEEESNEGVIDKASKWAHQAEERFYGTMETAGERVGLLHKENDNGSSKK